VSINVGVVDYGMGNLHSVAKALQSQGARATVSSSALELNGADLLVLPGVGSFGAAMETLKEKQLDGFVRGWIKQDRPFLGICLGLQLLFESSEESPDVPGLGVLPGKVVRFRGKMRIPHMGWNTVKVSPAAKTYFKGVKADDRFYFVHSYYPVPKKKADIATSTMYGKVFCSAAQRGNLFATQYHPEKSGELGLRLLQNILNNVKTGVGA